MDGNERTEQRQHEELTPAEMIRGSVSDVLGSQLPVWTSLDLSTDENKRLFLFAKEGEPDKIGDRLDKPFEVSDLIMHLVEDTDEETSEMRTWTRYVLIGPNGEMVAGGGDGVVRSLKTIMMLYGNPTWAPPLSMIVRRVKAEGTRYRHFIEIVK